MGSCSQGLWTNGSDFIYKVPLLALWLIIVPAMLPDLIISVQYTRTKCVRDYLQKLKYLFTRLSRILQSASWLRVTLQKSPNIHKDVGFHQPSLNYFSNRACRTPWGCVMTTSNLRILNHACSPTRVRRHRTLIIPYYRSLFSSMAIFGGLVVLLASLTSCQSRLP